MIIPIGAGMETTLFSFGGSSLLRFFCWLFAQKDHKNSCNNYWGIHSGTFLSFLQGMDPSPMANCRRPDKTDGL